MRGCANKSAPKPSLPPLCFGCARPMQLVRKTPRFGELPDVCTLECRACGVWHIEEGDAVLCRPADLGAVMSLGAAVSAVQPRQANANETSSVAASEGSEGGEELVAVAVNDALEGAYGRHIGKRRNHTKGFGATGYFVGTKEAAQLSRSGLFAGDTLEVIARFSVAGGDPSASDSERSPRGQALEFRLKTAPCIT